MHTYTHANALIFRRTLQRLVVLLGLAGASVTAQVPQPATLTLTAALREADRLAFANRLATATTAGDRARARLPLKGILPTLRVETAAIRTTDPIGAFSGILRQRTASPAAFDPARLNDPAAISNVQGGLVVEVPLFNRDAWLGRRAALDAAGASAAAGDWTASSVRTDVLRSWFGAVLASEKVAMLTAADLAAAAAVRQVESMVRQGLVTKADQLQASVHEIDVASQRLAAIEGAITARAQLAFLLGRSDGAAITLPAALPDAAAVRRIAERDTATAAAAANVRRRGDVLAANAGVYAAAADSRRAASTMLPRVNSFARYDWFAPDLPFAGRKSWTVGVMASWSVFSGGSELADLAQARARHDAAIAGAAAATAQARLEADVSRRAIVLALNRLDLADRAAEQGHEAHRLVEKRYAGGLATAAELLAASAADIASTLARSAAHYALIDTIATHRRAIGATLSDLAALDDAR